MVEKYSVGEIYTETVDRISDAGNGLITVGPIQLNLGKMRPSRVGDKIKFKYTGGQSVEIIGFPTKVRNPIFDDDGPNKNDLLNGNQ
jgi:hypothetical protein